MSADTGVSCEFIHAFEAVFLLLKSTNEKKLNYTGTAEQLKQTRVEPSDA